MTADPVADGFITMQASNSWGPPTRAWLQLGLSQDCRPALDGTLLVDLLIQLSLPMPAGGLNLSALLPCDPTTYGLPLFLQVLQFDPGASAGLSFTPGLEMVIGS